MVSSGRSTARHGRVSLIQSVLRVLGEMEETIMNGMCSTIHLVQAIVDGAFPEEVEGQQELLESRVKGFKTGLYSSKSTFSRQSQACSDQDWVIPRGETQDLAKKSVERQWIRTKLRDLVDRCVVSLCKKALWQARTFRPSRLTTTADCVVQYWSSGERKCGEIREIFALHSWEGRERHLEGIYAAVRSYRTLTPAESQANPFRGYPDAGILLARNRLAEDAELVPVGQIISHLLVCRMEFKLTQKFKEYVAMIAVDEVRLLISIRSSAFDPNLCFRSDEALGCRCTKETGLLSDMYYYSFRLATWNKPHY